MAFATLEEAWGIPSAPAPAAPRFGSGNGGNRLNMSGLGGGLGGGGMGSLGGGGGGRPGSLGSLGSLGGGGLGGLGGQSGGGGNSNGLTGLNSLNSNIGSPANNKPPTSPKPTFFTDGGGAVELEVRRFLADQYAKYGIQGVLRVLPHQAASRLGNRRRSDSLGDQVVRFLRSPEKLLLVLLAAFALLVFFDAKSPEVQLQHMHPFPMMPGMTLTTS